MNCTLCAKVELLWLESYLFVRSRFGDLALFRFELSDQHEKASLIQIRYLLLVVEYGKKQIWIFFHSVSSFMVYASNWPHLTIIGGELYNRFPLLYTPGRQTLVELLLRFLICFVHLYVVSHLALIVPFDWEEIDKYFPLSDQTPDHSPHQDTNSESKCGMNDAFPLSGKQA